jgi:hypothetical protein
MKTKVRKILASAAAMTVIGGGLTVAQTSSADATIIVAKNSATSQRTLKMCDLWGGKGLCNNVRAGHYSYLVVGSVRRPNGCELWMSGTRIESRNGATWHNFYYPLSKRTLAAKFCV